MTGNGKSLMWYFIAGAFIFGWAIHLWGQNAIAQHCRDAEASNKAIRAEMINRDEIMLKELTKELNNISIVLSELKTDIKYLRQNGVK